MTSTPERLYNALYFAEKLDHRFRGERYLDAVQVSIHARNEWNDYAWSNCEVAFEIRGTASSRAWAEVKVLRVRDDAWTFSAEGHTNNCGFAGPFAFAPFQPTREKACRAGIGRILAWSLRQSRRTGESTAELSAYGKLIAECRRALAPKRIQASLL